MEQVTDELLQRMVKVIVAETNPEQIILFGSYARGNATAASDVDFVIVESGSFGEGKERCLEAARFGALVEYNSYAVQFRYATTPDVGPLDRAAALRLLEEPTERVRTMLECVKE